MTPDSVPNPHDPKTEQNLLAPAHGGAFSGAALWTAVWAGKATAALSRITGRGGGTTLPGDVARLIDPQVLRKLSKDLKFGSIVITGSNGKTTTARLISSLLEGAGHRVVSNRSGA